MGPYYLFIITKWNQKNFGSFLLVKKKHWDFATTRSVTFKAWQHQDGMWAGNCWSGSRILPGFWNIFASLQLTNKILNKPFVFLYIISYQIFVFFGTPG